ncbi:hypothetical protein K5X82_03530 [Halosquirtibacter xylanolyticus]|uniref:hypothetical protein n=1 Tax=Halosquirtibacter xylanolyticus TaxID=3374599 RepID=UPI00374A55C7|nr:hypothetical protein K5X82_03530 [Prolixibacteraceae bacterium]
MRVGADYYYVVIVVGLYRHLQLWFSSIATMSYSFNTEKGYHRPKRSTIYYDKKR